MKEKAQRHVPRSKDLSLWVVAVLFILFMSSVVVYRIAIFSTPEQHETIAENPRTPLPAGPRRHDSGREQP